MRRFLLILFFLALAIPAYAQTAWINKLDSDIQFYQQTDFGVLLVGTEESIYAVEETTGEIVWRRTHRGLDETSISSVPNTDLVLLSLDEGKKSRLEALDLISGETIWRSEKVEGDVMQMAVDPLNDVLTLVLIKKTRGRAGDEVKRKPRICAFSLTNGKKLWEDELSSEIELMPSQFAEDSKISFTIDNFRPPMIVDGKLYVFYEGITIYDVKTGKKMEREKFKVNESGLALTEADPVIDQRNIFASGRGQIRAIDRKTGESIWKADDLGVTPEMFLVGEVLYVRTGGQFTKIRSGERVTKGSFGISAINASNGKTIWRYKGADNGLTNFVFADANTIIAADKDDLYAIDASTGKRLEKIGHKLDLPEFVIRNENGEIVVGGKERIAAFRYSGGKFAPLWTAVYKPPSRGKLRIISAIALRAAALYFRYGSLANSLYNLGQTALTVRSALSMRSSILRSGASSLDLTSLATNFAKYHVSQNIRLYGVAQKARNINGLIIERPRVNLNSIVSKIDVKEKLMDRLDPARQLERLSSYLLIRKRLAELRGNHMYFYTDLPKPFEKKGLLGVNIHTGEPTRFIAVSDPDPRFIADEISGLLFSANGKELSAFKLIKQ